MTKTTARKGRTAAYPRISRRLRHVILLVAPLCLAGCWLVQPIIPPCPSVLRSPVQVNVTLYGPPSSNRNFRLSFHEGGGLELQLIPWEVRCARLSERQEGSWLQGVDLLARNLQPPDHVPPGERLSVSYGRDFHAVGTAGLHDFNPEMIAALRTLSCIAFDEFGRNATRAFRGATPELTQLIGYPEACRAAEQAGGQLSTDDSRREKQ